jgi:hypothetical protein
MPWPKQVAVSAAQRAHFSGDIGGISRKPDRVPVAAQPFAYRRGAADRGQLGPGRGRLHGAGRAEIAIPRSFDAVTKWNSG